MTVTIRLAVLTGGVAITLLLGACRSNRVNDTSSGGDHADDGGGLIGDRWAVPGKHGEEGFMDTPVDSTVESALGAPFEPPSSSPGHFPAEPHEHKYPAATAAENEKASSEPLAPAGERSADEPVATGPVTPNVVPDILPDVPAPLGGAVKGPSYPTTDGLKPVSLTQSLADRQRRAGRGRSPGLGQLPENAQKDRTVGTILRVLEVPLGRPSSRHHRSSALEKIPGNTYRLAALSMQRARVLKMLRLSRRSRFAVQLDPEAIAEVLSREQAIKRIKADAGATLTLGPIPHRLDSKPGMAQSLHLTTLLGDLNGESTNRNDRRRKRDRALESAQSSRDRLKRALIDTLLGREEAKEQRATR